MVNPFNVSSPVVITSVPDFMTTQCTNQPVDLKDACISLAGAKPLTLFSEWLTCACHLGLVIDPVRLLICLLDL
jgi:hypothetical protein